MVKFDKAFFRLDGRLHSWSPGFGAQLESKEWRRVPAGTERKLLGETFRVWRSDREGLKFTTTWGMVNLPSNLDEIHEHLREFKAKLAKLI